MGEPVWANEARKAAVKTADAYKQALRQIAEGLARHDGCERVLENHVREAARVLAISANSRKPWYKRPELEISIGGVIFGWAGCVPDFVSGFVPNHAQWKESVIPAAMIVMVIVGSFLVSHGWLRIRGIV